MCSLYNSVKFNTGSLAILKHFKSKNRDNILKKEIHQITNLNYFLR